MESLTESSSSSKPGFFKHVFNFDSDSKAEMLNIIQYAILALIPIIILNKLMQKYIPEADEEKGSLEISAEVLLQIIIIVLGIFFVDRLVTYVPTYSGIKYLDFSVTTVVIATLLILLSLQTKLGEKISLLFDRVMELWDGPSDKDDKKKKGKGKGSVKVSQPISGQGGGQQQMQQQQSPDQSAQMQSLYGGSTPINQLPTSSTTSQQLPNYNEMYSQSDQNPLQNAATPGGFGESMIMAANEALGGSAFGSNF
jgi:hypothetical protein